MFKTEMLEMSKQNMFDQPNSRRSFLSRGAAATAAVAMAGLTAHAEIPSSNSVSAGDIAVLKFLAAAELVEDDLWQQYCELATNNPAYMHALQRIDPALPQYVCDDRDDERSHASFINGFLEAIGQAPVNLDAFRTLPSVNVRGAEQRGRLTNLRRLTVDTSWYYRYRSNRNPDFGATFPQIATIVNQNTVPVSRDSEEHEGGLHGVAEAAAFHFATIEQGGSSLYASLYPKVSNLDVLRILTSIGPVEVYHFATFHTSLENITRFNQDESGEGETLEIPNLKNNPDLAFAVMPEPCEFLDPRLPLCSVIRPSSTAKAGAVATATALVQSGLFMGQSSAFLNAVVALATAADNAQRSC